MTLRRPDRTMYSESVGSPPAITVVERGALFRVTTPASMRSWSSGKLEKSGTAFRTAVETVEAIPAITLLTAAGDRGDPVAAMIHPPDALVRHVRDEQVPLPVLHHPERLIQPGRGGRPTVPAKPRRAGPHYRPDLPHAAAKQKNADTPSK